MIDALHLVSIYAMFTYQKPSEKGIINHIHIKSHQWVRSVPQATVFGTGH